MKKKTVFISGHFNILHPGHLRLFRFAKECADYLIVGIESDKLAGNDAHINEHLRLEGVQSNNWIDEAFIISESVIDTIKKLKPDYVVKGIEHESKYNPELIEIEKYGGQLLFSSGEIIFSSVDLLRKEFSEVDNKPIVELLQEYLLRHQINVPQLKAIIDNFIKLKVCVIGDFIADEYITCQPLGMSQEDPTIVVTPIDTTKFIGGAGIVAAHSASLGANVNFISVAGSDETKKFAINQLKSYGVNVDFIEDPNRPTTLKKRYRCKGKTLLRVSHLHQGAISSKLQELYLQKIKKALKDCNLLIFSDFNYGCLPQPLVEKVIQYTKSKGIMMVADSQSSSQMGDISRFNSMDLITPTEREARLALRNQEDGLVVLAEKLRLATSSKNILLKLGEEGLLIHSQSENNNAEFITDRIIALNSSPKDVAGAGDSLLVASALTLATGGSILEAACLGSLAAAIQVSRVGNTPLSTKEFHKILGIK